MKTRNQQWLLWAGFACMAVSLIAWHRGENQFGPIRAYAGNFQDDTSKPGKKTGDKKEYRIGDLDRAMKELDRAMIDIDKSTVVDYDKMDKEIKIAVDEIKKIDFEKINKEVEASLKNIDWSKTRAEIAKAMRDVEVSMKEIDKKQIKEQLARVKEQIEKAKIVSTIDMKKMKETMEAGMVKAREGIEKAKKELGLLKEFTNELEKDGLINKKKGFRIEIKSGEMYINGTKQSKEVNDKYRKYFKDEDYTIKSDGEDIASI